ncbi:MAG: hypothetical protein AAF467_22345 [Actinomycetota bacterium]
MTLRRLEGSNVDPEMTEGLSARIADPLWMLTRQWQVGEFHGEDAASPVLMTAEVEDIPITSVMAGKDTVVSTTALASLEAVVEAEPVRSGPAALRWRLEAGEALVTELRRQGYTAAADTLVRAFQPDRSVITAIDELRPLDPVGCARLRMLAVRTIDGRRLYDAVQTAEGSADDVPELASLSSDETDLIDAWVAGEDSLFTDSSFGTEAWIDDRLEYRFAVTAGNDTHADRDSVLLRAEEYPGGTLDWYHFDVAQHDARPRRSWKDEEAERRKRESEGRPPDGDDGDGIRRIEVLASPLRYAGQPASRWWEFEDGDVAFGDLRGGPDDIARSVVASFAAVAGDDWFMVPAEVGVGTLSRVRAVRVLDCFDHQPHVIRPTAVVDHAFDEERPWKFFELTGDASAKNGLSPMVFVPPVLDTVEQGRPLEAIEFRRDELSNLAWAIERRVESPAGRAVDRETLAPGPPPELEPGEWGYTFMTEVPANWLPLVPVRVPRSQSWEQILLRRGRIAHREPTEAEEPIDRRPRSVLLDDSKPFFLQEEEIPAGGLRVTRRFQMARTHLGEIQLWVGRRKAPSGGPMRRSPLRFDHLRRRPAEDPDA